MSETAVAVVKLLAAELGLAFTEDADYYVAVELAVRAYEMGRLAAAVDVEAEAEVYTSAVMAPVKAAFVRAASVAAHGRGSGDGV